MEAVRSLFQFEDFTIVNFAYKYAPPKEPANPKDFIDKYLIDIDFAFQKRGDKMFLLCKVSINQIDNPLPGYSIFAEGFGVFDPELGSHLKGDKHVVSIQYPALSSALNHLRNVITTVTSQGPWGAYFLPMIVGKDLFKKKMEILDHIRKESKDEKNPNPPVAEDLID